MLCVLKETGEDYGCYLRNSTYCSNATVFSVEISASTVCNKEIEQKNHYDNQEFKKIEPIASGDQNRFLCVENVSRVRLNSILLAR